MTTTTTHEARPARRDSETHPTRHERPRGGPRDGSEARSHDARTTTRRPTRTRTTHEDENEDEDEEEEDDDDEDDGDDEDENDDDDDDDDEDDGCDDDERAPLPGAARPPSTRSQADASTDQVGNRRFWGPERAWPSLIPPQRLGAQCPTSCGALRWSDPLPQRIDDVLFDRFQVVREQLLLTLSFLVHQRTSRVPLWRCTAMRSTSIGLKPSLRCRLEIEAPKWPRGFRGAARRRFLVNEVEPMAEHICNGMREVR